jgi:hypothetical protein
MSKKEHNTKICVHKTTNIQHSSQKDTDTSPNITYKERNKVLIHKKKQLNKELYHSHILNTNIWQQTWANIEQAIHEKLQHEMTRVQQKISNLE